MKVLEKYHLKSQTPATPPIPQIFALSKSLDFYLEEGMENAWARHKKVSDYVKQRCKGMGFSVFGDEKYASQTLSCIESGDINAKDLLGKMKEKGYIIGAGYGKNKETTFRVGNMGNVHMGDAKEMLDVMEDTLRKI